MEKESELLATRNAVGNSVLLTPLQPLPFGKTLFKIAQPDNADDDDDDDDGNDCISLKEWQPAETTSPRRTTAVAAANENGTSYSAWKPVKDNGTSSNVLPSKGSTCTLPIGYSPTVETSDDVCSSPPTHRDTTDEVPLSVPERNVEEDQHEDDSENGSYEDCLEDVVKNQPEAEPVDGGTVATETEHRPKTSHHQHNISLANGIAPSNPTAGNGYDITLDDRDNSLSRRSTGSSRGSSLRVSFINEVMIDSPSPPRKTSKSPLRTQKVRSRSPPKRPSWDSSAKIGKSAPPMPKKFVQPTLHGIKVKKGQGGVAKIAKRASMTSAEIENSLSREGRSSSRGLVAQSWDSQQYRGGSEFDGISQMISSPLAFPSQEKTEDTHKFSSTTAKPFVPKSNGIRNHEVHDSQKGGEDFKPIMESNSLTGDLGKLFNKLRRSSAPLSKPPSKPQSPAPTTKLSAVPVLSKMTRANSTPAEKTSSKKTLAPLHSLDSSGVNQKFTIGSHASLKLLQECALSEKSLPSATYKVRKPRKIRDHEPHIHFYKTISKTLDSKLK
ncbi:uncharacterized protein [Physcomitrium patens]|uniref:Uncharacterized protein n=1 Tax=Physcomitrium patens TaxID=3218 RepID=A0A2K1KQI6_PHYPA|nr:uncharacterized protein LOC112281676 [Physcomitrium patens]XP_024374232.1 uncharacterized protein LOC112281676 [Physcomitrium patens]PNR56035.1 hypothetical protein PHYPA_006932 [Physcomitrium patens]|eukprot:XP_024374231.1 uncharacterized protein LOC112281676 [Physcomitrella patens]